MFGINLKSGGQDIVRAACRKDARLFNKGAGMITDEKICELRISFHHSRGDRGKTNQEASAELDFVNQHIKLGLTS